LPRPGGSAKTVRGLRNPPVDKGIDTCYNTLTLNNKEQAMNERIRELAEQCVGDRPYNNSFDYEKFAELIIQECIVDFYRNYLDTTSDDDITEQVDRYVKQNFGVE
jgi:hypothetical protein